jgi:hypothetical protein
MKQRLTEIHARRQRLIAKAAAERRAIALSIDAWRKPLGAAERMLAAVHYVRAHPIALVLAAATVTVVAPRRTIRWVRRGFVLWRSYRWVVRALTDLAH